MALYFVDIHSHLLPGVDDGSRTLAESVEMAKLAVSDGVGVMACTPHCNPGVYDLTAASIGAAVERLRTALDEAGVELRLEVGADVHLVPDLARRLASGEAPTLAGGRYFLLEPPHDLCPPGVERVVEQIVAMGYRPIITHPERYRWIESKMNVMRSLRRMGCLFQITAASVTGRFGSHALKWSERFVREGLADMIASDAHHAVDRKPGLSAARDKLSEWLGPQLADRMASHIPFAVLRNHDPEVIVRLREAAS